MRFVYDVCIASFEHCGHNERCVCFVVCVSVCLFRFVWYVCVRGVCFVLCVCRVFSLCVFRSCELCVLVFLFARRVVVWFVYVSCVRLAFGRVLRFLVCDLCVWHVLCFMCCVYVICVWVCCVVYVSVVFCVCVCVCWFCVFVFCIFCVLMCVCIV